MSALQDERFSYVVLRRGGRKVGASQVISRHNSDAADMHDPQPYLDAQPRSWKKSEARYQRALALQNLMEGASACPCISSVTMEHCASVAPQYQPALPVLHDLCIVAACRNTAPRTLCLLLDHSLELNTDQYLCIFPAQRWGNLTILRETVRCWRRPPNT